MLLRNPFLLVIQVRDYGPELAYYSDDVCLLLLPCPRSLLLIFSALYDCFVDLLPCCGDVESNPGPTEAMLQKILDEIRQLKESSGAATQRLSETCDKLSVIERKLDELSGTVTSYTSKVDKLQQQVDSLVYKIDDLENRSRRDNLIVYGIKEIKDEKVELLEQVVSNDILGALLKVENVGIERIHRIGRKTDNKCRPVIFKLVDGRDKARILKNCKNLKDTGYGISEDFSSRVRAVRKKLWDSTAELRARGTKVTQSFDKIKVDGKLFVWDDTLGSRVPFAPQ